MKVKIFIILILFSLTISAQTGMDSFPIAVWLQSTSNAAKYKDAGINMYVGLWNGLDQTQLNDLKNAGMKVMCGQNAFALSHLNDTSIYGWTQGDEPDNAQWNSVTKTYDSCINPSIIISRYDTMKIKDATRPVYLNLGMGVAYTIWAGRGPCEGKINMYPVSKNGYLKGCDIASFDIYPVNSSDGSVSGNLWYVPKGIDSLRKWTDYKKPVWCWIEATLIDDGSPRIPTAAEVKSEVWMALIHGVSGFGYFCHSFYPSQDDAAMLHDINMIAAVKEINMQVHSLAGALKSSNGTFANVTSSNTSVPVDYVCKSYKNERYIFAVAMRKGTTTATFTVDSGNSVQVLGENRAVAIKDKKFSDTFTAYGVHLYKLSSEIIPEKISIPQGIPSANVYPNPLVNQSAIEFDPAHCPCTGTIYDLFGNKVLEETLIKNGRFTISRERLNSGMYFYKITAEGGNVIYSGKLEVQ